MSDKNHKDKTARETCHMQTSLKREKGVRKGDRKRRNSRSFDGRGFNENMQKRTGGARRNEPSQSTFNGHEALFLKVQGWGTAPPWVKKKSGRGGGGGLSCHREKGGEGRNPATVFHIQTFNGRGRKTLRSWWGVVVSGHQLEEGSTPKASSSKTQKVSCINSERKPLYKAGITCAAVIKGRKWKVSLKASRREDDDLGGRKD